MGNSDLTYHIVMVVCWGGGGGELTSIWGGGSWDPWGRELPLHPLSYDATLHCTVCFLNNGLSMSILEAQRVIHNLLA